MSDASYGVEIRIVSKNGWFTPDESRAYYGRYARSGYCVHWWGDGTGADNHDNICNYIANQAAAGNKSVNYVLSDNKISLLVGPDNVAWCQQSGNATEISVETQPTLGDEGYKKHGWLKDQLEQREGHRLTIHGHYYWYQTQCCGTISLDRIEQETDKWRRGVYDQPPVPAPVPPATPPPAPQPTPVPPITPIPTVKKYTLNNAKLVNIKDLSVVKTFPLDTPIDIGGTVTYNGQSFFVSVYARDHGTNQGFLVGDLKDAPTPVTPPTPPKPEWEANLLDIDDTPYWFTKQQDLIDIKTGKPTGTKTFAKDEQFVSSAVTKVGNVEYRITDYSFKKGIFNGVPISSLTLTPPTVPDIPPVPHVPTVEDRLTALEKLVASIKAFIEKIFNVKL